MSTAFKLISVRFSVALKAIERIETMLDRSPFSSSHCLFVCEIARWANLNEISPPKIFCPSFFKPTTIACDMDPTRAMDPTPIAKHAMNTLKPLKPPLMSLDANFAASFIFEVLMASPYHG